MYAPYSGITINSARRLVTNNFKQAGLESAALEARILVGHAAQLLPAELIANGHERLSTQAFAELSEMTARRLEGEPISHILGYRDFWKDRFIVNSDVLTPRPETEGVIEQAVNIFHDQPARSILDIGTGSGAIILSLLREFPKAKAVAVDISAAALKVAQENALSLRLECDFRQGDGFTPVTERFDLIVSNPPYITGEEMKDLPLNVARFEPELALFGGEDGLDFYNRFIPESLSYLEPSGWLIVEIGYRQAKDVCDIFKAAGFSNIQCHSDLSGHDRIIRAQHI